MPRNGTLLNLGICHTQQGQRVQARRELFDARRAAERDGQRDRVTVVDDYLRAFDADCREER